MLVNNKHLTTIWYEEKSDKVKIIDQRLIPFELKIVELNTVDEVCFAIREMQVRGAPLIGVTAAYGMYIASKENPDLDNLKKASDRINQTRPTAVNLSWALNEVMSKIADLKHDKISIRILEIANQIRQNDINNCKKIGEYGCEIIKKIYNELKWKPKISFEDGIKRTVKWYLNNKTWLNDVIKKNNYNLKRIGKIKK